MLRQLLGETKTESDDDDDITRATKRNASIVNGELIEQPSDTINEKPYLNLLDYHHQPSTWN